MVKFCTECGTKLDDDDLFCGECGTKQEAINSNPKDNSSSNFNLINKNNKAEIDRIKRKITTLTGKNLSDSAYFKARKNFYNVSDVHTYYKKILNLEAEKNVLEYDNVESRLDELFQIGQSRVIYELRTKKPTYLFKTSQDVEQYIGYGTVKNPIPFSDEEMEEINEKIKNSGEERSVALKKIIAEGLHEKTVEKIRKTKQVNISIPNGRKLLNSPLTGSLTGDIIGSGAGSMIGGLASAGDLLGSTMGALNGSLILGGAGALIGGLLAAKDDGIEWFDTVLVLDNEGVIIAGKLLLPYKDIRHINAEKGSKFDVVTFTMENNGLQFKTDDGLALKEVMEEMMENVTLDAAEPEQMSASDTSSSELDNVEALMKYAELFEKGLLSNEEFEAKKKELL